MKTGKEITAQLAVNDLTDLCTDMEVSGTVVAVVENPKYKLPANEVRLLKSFCESDHGFSHGCSKNLAEFLVVFDTGNIVPLNSANRAKLQSHWPRNDSGQKLHIKNLIGMAYHVEYDFTKERKYRWIWAPKCY